MKQLVSTEILISFLILLLLSNLYYIFFIKTGMLLVLVLGGLLIYISQYFRKKLRGLVLFWSGLSLLLFGLLSNPYTLIVLFSFLVIIAVRYAITKRKPVHVIVTADKDVHVYGQKWFNTQETPKTVYRFDDIHLQHAVGDVTIDLTNAANLQQENLIVVNHMIGKTTVIVPHHYQTKIDYSALYGQLKVDHEFTRRAKNERLTYISEDYENGVAVKVIVSSIVGDLEVVHR
ncbi:cell wall-active antibiotics response protein LiaF [Macrococcus equipercicus]|uniref:Cell wall-active antibiotics response protein n=1 Tax=Macrococcus equipercicus TaxID=69967 RepID=A0A9Q9BUP3_9STAP|nr:cell wall-active antibiotics response protein LiaF [Macrococcus equipercicus]KAA1037685.1 transporter [Macrococcus equipercicus]UTH13397.1 cell wall-active antibiotics response protein [Macrococcus equipercicus]